MRRRRYEHALDLCDRSSLAPINGLHIKVSNAIPGCSNLDDPLPVGEKARSNPALFSKLYEGGGVITNGVEGDNRRCGELSQVMPTAVTAIHRVTLHGIALLQSAGWADSSLSSPTSWLDNL